MNKIAEILNLWKGTIAGTILFMAILLLNNCKKNEPDYQNRIYYSDNHILEYFADSTITCITYNIQLGFEAGHDPWNKDEIGGTQQHLLELKDLFSSIDPDIICLQEVPLNRYNAEIEDFIRELGTALNMNVAFGAHGYNDPYGIVPVEGQWGNAILSKFEIFDIENKENEYISVWERRSILKATLILNDSLNINCYSLHFLPSNKAVPNANNYFKEGNNLNQIIMGDFNMTEIPDLETNGYLDIFNQDSNMRFSIDKIFTKEGAFEVIKTGKIKDSDVLSDHPANYAVLKFR